ncbi:MAG TPA: diphthine synthase [Methanothrix sp.]
MLYFIGLGLYDESDISVKGLEAVRAANKVYAEFYTSRLMGTTSEKLEALYGKRVSLLSREEVEVDPVWLEEAREKDVAFLVGGDAMVSTTHLDLRLRAAKMGIRTRVIHASSIVTAVSGMCGLQNYRFGRSTTIPFPYMSRGKRIIPETPYQVLLENLGRNLHTMLFLDIQSQPVERYMTVNEGATLLLEMQEKAGGRILDNTLGIGIARAGSLDATVRADLLPCLTSFDFGGPLQIMIIPAKLHFMEAEGLRILADAPASATVDADRND